MNELGSRLDSLADAATGHLSLVDPSIDPTPSRRTRRPQVLAAGLLLLMLVTALFVWSRSTDTSSTSVIAAEGQTAVAAPRAQWEATGIDDYRIRYAAQTPASRTGLADVLVEAGEPRLVGETRRGTGPTPIWTIDDLFDLVETADDVQEVSFEPTLGYPTEISVDPDRSIAGDEILVFVTEFLTVAEIEAAETDLRAWFPEPVELPDALTQVMQRMSVRQFPTIEPGDSYQLNGGGDVEVYVYRTNEDLCVLTAALSPSSSSVRYGGIGESCQSVAAFGRDGHWTASSNDFGAPAYLLVVPPARYLSQPWQIEVTTTRAYTIDRTDRSALVYFESAGPAETVEAILRCECGDLTYAWELMAGS